MKLAKDSSTKLDEVKADRIGQMVYIHPGGDCVKLLKCAKLNQTK